jgi:hypothetical protein
MKKTIVFTAVFCFAVLSAFAVKQPDHSILDRYLGKYVSGPGVVNYQAMKLDMDTLDAYLLQVRECPPPTNEWSADEKTAYYLNAYNAYMIKFVLSKYPAESIKDISYSGKDIWNFRMANLGGTNYTLTQLETDFIRKTGDPRVYFAFNCLAASSPRLLNGAYTGEELNSQLTAATKTFVTDTKHNILAEKKIQISEIFSWHLAEFTGSGKTLVEFLNQYSPVTISASAKVEYLPYSWSLRD